MSLKWTSGPLPSETLVLSLGNFDGCHIGHQALLRANIALSTRLKASSCVISFSPHPKVFFKVCEPFFQLYTGEQKQRILREFGVAHILELCFDQELSQLSPRSFCQALASDLRVGGVLVGEDYCFGHKRTGSVATLAQFGKEYAWTVQSLPLSAEQGSTYSSSNMRLYLEKGEVAKLNASLGRSHVWEGTVIHGAKEGRKLGFPTANLDTGSQLLGAHGVYFGWAILSSDPSRLAPLCTRPPNAIPAVANLGLRPTYVGADPKPRLEVHLLEGDYGFEALYGQTLSFYIEGRLREEIRFPSLASLKEQIAHDVGLARSLLRPAH